MKLNYFVIIVIFTLLIFPLSSYSSDTSSVRIMTDVENVSILINNDSLEFDSFGNRLMANKWFILNLPVDTYSISFNHPDYLSRDTVFVLKTDSLITLNINFLEPSPTVQPDNYQAIYSDSIITVIIRSVPSNANIMIDGEQIDSTTPYQATIDSGFHEFLVVSEGWEPLIHTIHNEGFNEINLNFLLKPLPPPKPEPESLGLIILKEHPLIDIGKADNIKKKYMNLAEFFLIVPLSQGLIMKTIVGADDEGAANILIGSGVILTGGSYLLGKLLSSKKRKQITIQNELLTAENNDIKTRNNEIKNELKRIDREAYQQWLEENTDKGRVEVITR